MYVRAMDTTAEPKAGRPPQVAHGVLPHSKGRRRPSETTIIVRVDARPNVIAERSGAAPLLSMSVVPAPTIR